MAETHAQSYDIIGQVFSPLYGKPCWNARPGYGSFLTMEFGEPYLKIVEPRLPDDDASDWLKKHRARRQISVMGDWHLWIYCCQWHVFTGSELVGESDLQGSTKECIQRAANELDGQKLVRVSVIPENGTATFEFDLGSRLETQPYDENSDQWLLYEPSGRVFTYGPKGQYSHQPGNTPTDEEKRHSFA